MIRTSMPTARMAIATSPLPVIIHEPLSTGSGEAAVCEGVVKGCEVDDGMDVEVKVGSRVGVPVGVVILVGVAEVVSKNTACAVCDTALCAVSCASAVAKL